MWYLEICFFDYKNIENLEENYNFVIIFLDYFKIFIYALSTLFRGKNQARIKSFYEF